MSLVFKVIRSSDSSWKGLPMSWITLVSLLTLPSLREWFSHDEWYFFLSLWHLIVPHTERLDDSLQGLQPSTFSLLMDLQSHQLLHYHLLSEHWFVHARSQWQVLRIPGEISVPQNYYCETLWPLEGDAVQGTSYL